jgi:aspartate/glutamate racemase
MAQFQVTRKGQSWYGESIGILILDASYPCIPGNVGNASTFPFPVRYQKVSGASIDRLLNQRDPGLLEPFIAAAKKLESRGVRAITGACGFMAQFQPQVRAAVSIPVFLTSLLQIPFIFNITGKPVGVITANSSCLTVEHFRGAGIPDGMPMIIAGMEEQTEFREAVLEEKGTLDSDKIEQETVEVARELVRGNPHIGAMLLECSDLPPYARAVQQAVNLPVYDFYTMIHYVHTAHVRLPFVGFM